MSTEMLSVYLSECDGERVCLFCTVNVILDSLARFPTLAAVDITVK